MPSHTTSLWSNGFTGWLDLSASKPTRHLTSDRALITYSSTWDDQDNSVPDAFGLDVNGPQHCDCLKTCGDCAWNSIHESLRGVVRPNTLESLNILHGLPQTVPLDSLTFSDVQRNSRKLYTLELRLSNPVCQDEYSRDSYATLVHNAARLYVSRALRNLPRGSVLVSSLLQNLTSSLRCVQNPVVLRDLPNEQLTAILWALLLSRYPLIYGSCMECDPWHIHIFWIFEKLCISSYEQLLGVLKGIAWMTGFMAVELKGLFPQATEDSRVGNRVRF